MIRPSAWPVLLALWFGIGPLARADDRPFPRDPARIEQRSRAMLTWNRRLTVGEYDRAGRKDPRWDAAVREALEMTARRFALQDPLPQHDELNRAARRALDAGSVDPLVLYIYSQTSVRPDCFPGDDEFVLRSRRAADALRASDYSPYRRALGEFRWITYRLRPDTVDDAGRAKLAQELDAVARLIGPSIKVDPRGEFWEEGWYETLREIYLAQRWVNGDQAQPAFDRVDALLARVPGVEALRLALRGKFFADYAWEARGAATAGGTSPKQFATFEERLLESRRALEAAYKLNPAEPTVARNRVLIARGLGEDRATMETWFARAVTIDPDDQDACYSKLSYLLPRWQGDPEGRDALDFGHACGATRDWRNGVELLESEAIFERAMRLGPAGRRRYMTRPEVWPIIRGNFDDYLRRYPHNATARSKYAFLAYLCERYKEADAIFRQLGDDLTAWDGMATVTIQGLKGFRTFCATKAAESAPPDSKAPPGQP